MSNTPRPSKNPQEFFCKAGHPTPYVACMARKTIAPWSAIGQQDELLTTEAAAARVGLSPTTLKCWRWERNPHAPPHITVGARNIRYSAAAIEEWKKSRTKTPGRKSRSARRST